MSDDDWNGSRSPSPARHEGAESQPDNSAPKTAAAEEAAPGLDEMVRWRMLDCTAKQCKAELDLRDPLEEGKHKINGQLINGESKWKKKRPNALGQAPLAIWRCWLAAACEDGGRGGGAGGVTEREAAAVEGASTQTREQQSRCEVQDAVDLCFAPQVLGGH